MRGEVPNDVGRVSSPEGDKTLFPVGACKRVPNTFVRGRKAALFDLLRQSIRGVQIEKEAVHHLILVLYQQLDTLNWRSTSFGDGLEKVLSTTCIRTKVLVLTAETPPIMKSTVQRLRYSKDRIEGRRTGKILRSLDLLCFGHFFREMRRG